MLYMLYVIAKFVITSSINEIVFLGFCQLMVEVIRTTYKSNHTRVNVTAWLATFTFML